MLEAFASFGFCKAHAAAFALPTYQSAWLKAHYPAHFLAGVLTHDPGMYPKRLILDDARQFGIAVLGLDVNASEKTYVVERVVTAETAHSVAPQGPRTPGRAGLRDPAGALGGQGDQRGGGGPDRRGPALPLAHRLLAPRAGLPAGRGAAGARRRVRPRLRHRVARSGTRRRGKVTRRDLLLQVADLDRHARAVDRAAARRGRPAGRSRPAPPAATRADDAAARNSSDPLVRRPPGRRRSRGTAAGRGRDAPPGGRVRAPEPARDGVWAQAARQSQATRKAAPVTSVQLALDLGDTPVDGEVSGLPEMNASERVRAELEILGLDVSRHVVDFYAGSSTRSG